MRPLEGGGEGGEEESEYLYLVCAPARLRRG